MRPIKQVQDYLKEQLKTITDNKLLSKLKRKSVHDGTVTYLNTLRTKMFNSDCWSKMYLDD